MKNVIIGVLVIAVTGLGLFILLGNNDNAAKTSQTSSSVGSDAIEEQKSLPLKELDLSNKNLTQVQKDILDNKSITKLDVSENALTGSLPAEIRKLTSLEILDASNNKLTGIPAEIGQLENLKEANFANNNISGLPLEIGKLKNLKTLDLRGNPNVSQYDIGLLRQQLSKSQILTD